MVEENADGAPTSRPPTLDDLLLICRNLNDQGASYVVIGGFAMFEHGLARLTDDIDLLIENSPANVARVKKALECLPDRASRDVLDTDVVEYTVVRVNDEVTVDLMGSACGIDFGQAVALVDWRDIRGVRIPFASPALLWKTKQTYRQKDALDRSFLRKWFTDRGQNPPACA
ncbi:MAG TPA: nucleotidyltransferase [Kiritimatiellia bacterium]|nr:nucleotidyltransferase [Kiritimatiellia bacterium]